MMIRGALCLGTLLTMLAVSCGPKDSNSDLKLLNGTNAQGAFDSTVYAVVSGSDLTGQQQQLANVGTFIDGADHGIPEHTVLVMSLADGFFDRNGQHVLPLLSSMSIDLYRDDYSEEGLSLSLQNLVVKEQPDGQHLKVVSKGQDTGIVVAIVGANAKNISDQDESDLVNTNFLLRNQVSQAISLARAAQPHLISGTNRNRWTGYILIAFPKVTYPEIKGVPTQFPSSVLGGEAALYAQHQLVGFGQMGHNDQNTGTINGIKNVASVNFVAENQGPLSLTNAAPEYVWEVQGSALCPNPKTGRNYDTGATVYQTDSEGVARFAGFAVNSVKWSDSTQGPAAIRNCQEVSGSQDDANHLYTLVVSPTTEELTRFSDLVKNLSKNGSL